MSVHPLPTLVTNDTDGIGETTLSMIVRACYRYLRPAAVVGEGAPYSLSFTPDLTPTEAELLQRILGVVLWRSTLAPDDYVAIRAEVPGLRAYYLNATPTNAESVAALKSVIRILRAILHD